MTTKRLIIVNVLILILCGLSWSPAGFVSVAEGAPEWQATLWITSGGGKARLELGADPTATDGFDKAWDSYAMLGGSLRAYFPRPEWHPVFQEYWRDIHGKGPGSSTEWPFVIESDMVNTNVTVTWDLSLVPKDYPLFLVLDDMNGQQIDMRTNNSYSFTFTQKRNLRVNLYASSQLPPAMNHAPVANAGPDQIITVRGCGGAAVTLDGSASSDPDGDQLTYVWTWPGGRAEGQKPVVEFPMGTTTVMLSVTDGKGGSSTDTVKISVNDIIASALDVSVSPNILWPPTGTHVKVTPTITIKDACVSITKVELLSVTSNEPDKLIQHKDRLPDIMVRHDGSILLRAARAGYGSGRVYSITYIATDSENKTTLGTAHVLVPLSMDGDTAKGR
jgi:hypothetical protein